MVTCVTCSNMLQSTAMSKHGKANIYEGKLERVTEFNDRSCVTFKTLLYCIGWSQWSQLEGHNENRAVRQNLYGLNESASQLNAEYLIGHCCWLYLKNSHRHCYNLKLD